MQFTNLLLIGSGGAIGAVSRYLVAGFFNNKYEHSFPTGTFAVNLVGGLIIGIIWGAFELFNTQPDSKTGLFIIIGVMGGFTTFSAFSLDTYKLIMNKEYMIAGIYILLSNIGSILMTIIGHYLVKIFSNIR